MNNKAYKCPSCKKAFRPTKCSQIYCSAKCRQQGYRARKQKKTKTERRGEQSLIVAICEHCNGSFWAKRKSARFCSTSCRTLYHLAMKATTPHALMEAYHHIPQEKAFDIVETQPIRQVKQLLEKARYTCCHS
jgi:hypothetical protein